MLRYGVLGLLIERRDYGYQLVQRLSERVGAAWQLNPSAVYGALDQLEEADLIAATSAATASGENAHAHSTQLAVARPSRRAARVIYEATDSGVEEFQAWLARPSTRTVPIRSEIQLKVALAGPDHVPPLLASIEWEQSTIVQRLQAECQASGDPCERAPTLTDATHAHLCEETDVSGWSSAAAALVAAAASTRLQGELSWLEAVRAALQRMAPQHLAAAAGRSTASPLR